jgi:hypothetical protein
LPYIVIGIIILSVGFCIGYRVKKKVINDIPGVRRFKVKDFFALQPMLINISKRLEETNIDLEKDKDFDTWLDRALTLPEIRLLLIHGVKNPKINVDELDYDKAFKLWDKVRRKNSDFFMQALRAITATNLI